MRNLRNWALAVTMIFALTGLSAAQGRWDRDNDRDKGHNPKAEGRHDNGKHNGWYKNGKEWHDDDHDRDRDRNRRVIVVPQRPAYPTGGYRYPAGGGYYGGYPNNGGYYSGYPNGGYGYPNNGGYYGGYPNGGGTRVAYNMGYQDGLRHGQ